VREVWGKYQFPTNQRFEHRLVPGAKQDKTWVIPGFIFVIAFVESRVKSLGKKKTPLSAGSCDEL
jgi:hypothetical protein